MEQVGCEDYAEIIGAFVKDNMSDADYSCRPSIAAREMPPGGWKYLGSGAFRSAWEGPDGVVYKVEHYGRSSQTNEGEYAKLRDAWKYEPVEGVRLPSASYYPSCRVIAMEKIRGKLLADRYDYWQMPADITRLMRRCESNYDLWDLHTQNIIQEDDTDLLVPIDFGG